MKINPEWLGMIVAVSVVAILFGFHYISELIVSEVVSEIVVDSTFIQPTMYSDYCQQLNLDC